MTEPHYPPRDPKYQYWCWSCARERVHVCAKKLRTPEGVRSCACRFCRGLA